MNSKENIIKDLENWYSDVEFGVRQNLTISNDNLKKLKGYIKDIENYLPEEVEVEKDCSCLDNLDNMEVTENDVVNVERKLEMGSFKMAESIEIVTASWNVLREKLN